MSPVARPAQVGPVGRLGRWAATHVRVVVVTWVVLAIALGALAPRVEHALSGAGWEASGSESVRANAPPEEMVRAADDLKDRVTAAGSAGVRADISGAPGMWSDFNEANKSAMLKSEVISRPVTLAILLLAFGSLVAAGLPLMLTVLGLVCAARMLFLGGQLFDISIWAMNFALMFALALGIDYALFIVARFRQAHIEKGLSPVEAVTQAMDTAGKAVLFSGVTVLIALSAVLLVPSPAFRSMAVGIMLAVAFVLVASLPRGDPSGDPVRATIDRLRATLPPGALIGGAVAENHDLELALADATPLVIGVVSGMPEKREETA